MPQLILLRHGESVWNLENRFTGWVDVDLSPRGIEQAQTAGKKLTGIPIQKVFTSALTRAIRTATLALEAGGFASLPTERSAALNERHYGDLQGLNKDEARAKWGEEQVHQWRRSYDIAPPGPAGESLAMTLKRVLPYWESHILPCLKAGENTLIVAHGNSLRSLILKLEGLSPEQILEVELGTGVPILYQLEPSDTAPTGFSIKTKTVL